MAPSIDAETFKIFGFWGSILVLKILAMAVLTGRQRMRKKVFANPEDAARDKKAKIAFDDPDVERVRRAHLNDLENVVPWFIATWIWLGTGPSTWLAGLLIRVFVLSRILHTVVYAVVPLPQPSRAIAFFLGYFVTFYMTASTILYYSY
ncbi:microsomal glutathione S-transferase 1-like [Neodiprion virginianus]|uniref:microsomal glutathione S-transferase 1-like n=1 Tax=Neodiprion virginianus TaxID=2961670 RepID=UPI001EE741EB|nr:microsomal glutathione S-transferase 1-like [Neodiprion virginianus]